MRPVKLKRHSRMHFAEERIEAGVHTRFCATLLVANEFSTSWEIKTCVGGHERMLLSTAGNHKLRFRFERTRR